ncbi:hypothetical protein ES288_A09G013800v1 [Gossypium darwinii]|uniref:BED-type domain-containing protein n=1 Tax=Gossypium darwinii TaxID=34276 RepID=A0A5D2F6Q1_GOSDA|nr:hypothetical protein ES288_A09G013800v1 [Gossypium darwinii]
MTMASSNSPIHSTTSKVWDEMTKLECENKNELKAQCNHCKTILYVKSSNETSHLRRHLNICLKKVNKDISQYTIATQPSVGAVSTFLVCGKHSFRTVAKYMMSIASPNFKNISRYTAARDVLMYYAKERYHVKEELAKTPGLIFLTSDNWNSEHTNDEYICITAHWVDENWKLQKRIIRFRAYFLHKKIFSITLDNASYNDVMVSCLKNHFRANRAILYDGAFFQVRCCAPILNLIVKAGLKLADDVVGKIRNGIKYIKKSGFLCQDVCVGWNSTYLMLESSLYYKDEWRNVAILCKFLKVFYDMACVFSGSNYPTNNLYFRGVWKVHKDLLDTVKGPYSFLIPMYCFTTIYGIHASDFVETILSNLRLLFDKYVKKSKSTSSSLAGSSNVSDKNPVDSSLDEHNVNSLNSQIDVLDYWSKSLVRYNELSLLARDLLAIPISTVASESAFSMGKKIITPLRNSLKPKNDSSRCLLG